MILRSGRPGHVSRSGLPFRRRRLGVPEGQAPSFEQTLNRQAERRHTRILEADGLPPMPVGWRAEDILGISDGFVPLAEAARTMGVSEGELLDLARRGLIEAEQRGQRIYARPAILSVLAVGP